MTWRVIVGTLSLVVTMILLGYVAVTEPDRMQNFSIAYAARQVETGAALFENNCATCHGLDGRGTGRAPALNTPELLVTGERLQEVGYTGTIEDYIQATIAAGRPRATVGMEQYPERMPTWSEEFGGPMREDQIESLVAFIMNWAPAYANITPEPTEAVEGVGTDITVELPEGDPAEGEQLATQLGCTACHVGQSLIGPAWLASQHPEGIGIGARAELRVDEPDYTGEAETAAQYLFESIVQPSAYVVPGYQDLMPKDYGQTISAEQMADIIAYLQTLE